MLEPTKGTEPAKTQRTIIVIAFVIPGVVTFAIVGVMVYLWARGQPVPTELLTLGTAATGYCFGALPGFVKQFLELKT